MGATFGDLFVLTATFLMVAVQQLHHAAVAGVSDGI